MNSIEEIRCGFVAYAEAYPRMEPRDLLKYLFHSCFGCDHMVQWIPKENRYFATMNIQESCDMVIDSGLNG